MSRDNFLLLVLALILALLVGAFLAGRSSVHCPVPDRSALDSLRGALAGQQAMLSAASAKAERLKAMLDSAQAAPRPTIKQRVEDAYTARNGSAVHALIERMDAGPDSIP
jgi:hypothetical protein